MRWQGYEECDDTWEEFEVFAYDAPMIVSDYLVKIFQDDKKKEA